MRNNRRISALLSAMMMACTTAAFAAPANVTAAEAKGQFPKQIRNVNEVQEIDLTKMENGKLKYDFNNDKKCDYYDVREMEDAINGLYSDKKYYDVYERVDKNGKKLKDENGDQLYDYTFHKIENIPYKYKNYDINGDKALSPADYCSYLKTLSKQFDIAVSSNDGVNTQLTATIKGLADNAVIKDGVLAVPAEIYDIKTDRIYPVGQIAGSAFYGNNKIRRVEFIDYRQPDWVDEYGNRIVTRGQLTACTCLTIGGSAFENCTNLSEVVLPQNVSIGYNAFLNTPFDDNNGDWKGEIYVYTGTPDAEGRQTIIAYGAYLDDAIDANGTLTIPDNITAVNAGFAKGSRKLRNIVFSKNNSANGYAINYIGEDAFSECELLMTVNNKSFINNDEYLKDQMYRYISSFNSTKFMADETQRQLDKIVSKIKSVNGYDKMNEAEKALVAAKYLVNSTYYSAWVTTNDEFSLYPNALYQTIDIARGAIASENAALNVRFTECDGISRAYALVLDSIGIKNLTMGAAGHALNQVCIENKWYTFDLTGYCGDRGAEIMNNNKSNIKFSDYRGFDESLTIDVDPDKKVFTYKKNGEDYNEKSIVKDLSVFDKYYNVTNRAENRGKSIMFDDEVYEGTLSCRNFFSLFKNSAGKHIGGNKELYFYHNEDHSKFLLYGTTNGKRSRDEVMGAAAAQPALHGLYDYTDPDDLFRFDGEFKVYNKFTGRIYDKVIKFHDLPFYVDKDGYLYLEQNKERQYATLDYINGKLYAYDFKGFAITGQYTSGSELYIFDEVGCLTDTTYHPDSEWEYEKINGVYFVVIRDKNAEREQTNLEKNGKKVFAYLRKSKGSVYLEDKEGNPLSSDFTAYGYTWTFDTDGRFITTDCK